MIGRPFVRDVKPPPFATLGDHLRAKAEKKPRKPKKPKPLVDAFAGRAAGGGFVIVLPIVLVNEANEAGHTMSRAGRIKAQRKVVTDAMNAHLGDGKKLAARGPIDVTMTRLATHPLDDDSVPSSTKHVRDAIADWLGVNDRYRERVAYEARQEKSKAYGCRIWIRRRSCAKISER